MDKTKKQRPGKRSLKTRAKAHYYAYMPDKKHHRVLVWVLFIVFSVVVAGQLLYPIDHALPFARVAHKDVSWRNHEQLAELLDEQFRRTNITLAVDAKNTIELPLASMGAELQTEPMIKQLVDYPFWQRFIPFSILWHPVDITEVEVMYTDAVVSEASQKQAEALSIAAVNARLAIEEGQLIATSEQPGYEVTMEAVRGAITGASPLLGSTTAITVEAKRIEPAETAKSLQAVRSAAEAALARGVHVEAGGQSFAPQTATVALWLQIVTDDSGKPTLQIAEDKIAAFFDGIDGKVGTPAGRTNINLTNGHETSRAPGQIGRAINRGELKEQMTKWLLSGEGKGEFIASFHDVQPSIIYDSKYTTTQEGLQAYIDDAARRMNVRIAIQQVDGGKWAASTRADDSIPSASTYKLFVAKWLFDQMDKGLIHWNDPMLDTNVSVCFDRMTIASTNPCAVAWLAQVGRPQFNQYVWGLGFSQGTNFNMPDATHTTANDLQRMMLGIYDGTIISGANKDRLLHSLSSHPYGYGIPTGSKGKVYDKVGFLWDYVHDTAIVYHPGGTYIMTIMTKGQSYATIANLTREIERIMYP